MNFVFSIFRIVFLQILSSIEKILITMRKAGCREVFMNPPLHSPQQGLGPRKKKTHAGRKVK